MQKIGGLLTIPGLNPAQHGLLLFKRKPLVTLDENHWFWLFNLVFL